MNELGIPADMLPRARAWFDREMARLEQLHGDGWQEVRDWLAGYVSEEARELALKATNDAGARA